MTSHWDCRFSGEEVGCEGEGVGRASYVSGSSSTTHSGCERSSVVQGSCGANRRVEAACGMRSGSAAIPMRLHRRSLWPVDVGSFISPMRPSPVKLYVHADLESLKVASLVRLSLAVEWLKEKEGVRVPPIIGPQSPCREDRGCSTPGGDVRWAGVTVLRNPSPSGGRISISSYPEV
jgi:hypothetical protein